MQFLRTCAAFVFDMDGLLLDTERLSREALHTGARDVGVELPEDAFLELIGRRGPEIRRRLAVRLGDEALMTRIVGRSDIRYEELLARGVPVKDGVRELLEWMDARKLPCGVATSTGYAKAERKLAAAGLRNYFRAVIGGDQVEHGKPAPDVYLRAAKELGVDAKHCGVFEDSEPGLRAAHAAGTKVVWIPDLAPVPPEVQALATASASSLRAVFEMLEK